MYEVSETLFRKQVSDDREMFYLGREISETKCPVANQDTLLACM